MRAQKNPMRGKIGQQIRRAAKGELQSYFSDHKPQVSSASLELGGAPQALAMEGFLEDTSGRKRGACDDLAHIEKVEIQALLSFIGVAEGLGPGRKFAKLLLDSRSWAIFDGSAHNAASAPILSGKS